MRYYKFKMNPLICCMGELGQGDQVGMGPGASFGGFGDGFGASGGNSNSANFAKAPNMDLVFLEKNIKTAEDKLNFLLAHNKLGMDPVLTDSLFSQLSKSAKTAFANKASNPDTVLGKKMGKVFSVMLPLISPHLAGKIGAMLATQTGVLIGKPNEAVAGGVPGESSSGGKFIPQLSDTQYQEIADKFNVSVNDVKTIAGGWTDAVDTAIKEITTNYDNQIASGIKNFNTNSGWYEYDQGTTGVMAMMTEGEIEYLMKQIDPKELDSLISQGGNNVNNVLDAVIYKGGILPAGVIKKLLAKGDGDYALNSDGSIGTKGNPTDDDNDVVDGDGTTTEDDDDTEDIDEDLWDQFVSKVTTDLEGAVKDNTDFIAGEASAYNTATTGATDKANSVLNQLASDLKSGTGTFTPTNTKWGNYQPGSNFITAKSLASLAGQSMNNTISAAASTYANAPDRSPAKGTLAYLAALQGVAAEDKTFSIGEQELAIKQYLGELNATNDSDRTDAYVDINTPGILDNLGSVVNLGTGLANIGSTLKLW